MKGGPRVTPPVRPSARPHGRRQFDPLAELVERVGVDAGIWREVSREDAALMTRSGLHVRHVAFKLMESNEGRSFVPPRHRVVLER